MPIDPGHSALLLTTYSNQIFLKVLTYFGTYIPSSIFFSGCSRYNLLVVRSNFDSFIVHYPLILPTTLIWCQYRLWRHSLSIWQITSGTSWLSVSLGTNFKSSSIVSKSYPSHWGRIIFLIRVQMFYPPCGFTKFLKKKIFMKNSEISWYG